MCRQELLLVNWLPFLRTWRDKIPININCVDYFANQSNHGHFSDRRLWLCWYSIDEKSLEKWRKNNPIRHLCTSKRVFFCLIYFVYILSGNFVLNKVCLFVQFGNFKQSTQWISYYWQKYLWLYICQLQMTLIDSW